MKGEKVFLIWNMKHFIVILLGSVIVKLKLEFNTLMITLYIESLLSYYAIINQWYFEVETALYDHYRARGKGKSNIWSVWFDWKNNRCLLWKCVHAHTEKISSWLTLTSVVPFSICCRLISKRETSWLSVFSSLSNWFFLDEHEKRGQGIWEAFKFWSLTQLD